MARQAIVSALTVIGALLLAPSALAGTGPCPDQAPNENPFVDWDDAGNYFLAPGGDFDSGPSWALEGGAQLAPGLGPDGWGSSLAIPPSGSATSPPICVAPGYTHGRMFGQATEKPGRDRARVTVDVLYGARESSERLRLQEDWDATRSFDFAERAFELDPETQTGEIRLRLTADGPGTAVLDGVYIDPKMRH